MADFENKLQSVIEFFESDDSRRQVAAELAELTQRILALAPQYVPDDEDILPVTDTIRLSPITSYACWNHRVFFVRGQQVDTVGQKIPSSIEQQELFMLTASPDSIGYECSLTDVLDRVKKSFRANKYSKDYSVQNIATILVELRSAALAMESGEFTARWW